MKEIVIVSGKGGTGKTMFSASLAALVQNKVMADCDVDAANLHLLLSPTLERHELFLSGYDYHRIESRCVRCGTCKRVCRYEAINSNFDIDSLSCEGCAACYFACPKNAIETIEKVAGRCIYSDTNYGKFVHAELNPGEDNSGKLVARVKSEARRIAKENNADYLIIDGPPGIGCPVNAALTGSQVAVIVTEPTLSGIHDLNRIIKICQRFRMKIFVVINKANVDEDNNREIKKSCAELNISLAGEIPYSEAVIKTIVSGKTIIEALPNHEVSQAIQAIWHNIRQETI